MERAYHLMTYKVDIITTSRKPQRNKATCPRSNTAARVSTQHTRRSCLWGNSGLALVSLNTVAPQPLFPLFLFILTSPVLRPPCALLNCFTPTVAKCIHLCLIYISQLSTKVLLTLRPGKDHAAEQRRKSLCFLGDSPASQS